MRNVVIAVVIFLVMIIAMLFSLSYLNNVSSTLQRVNDELEQFISDDQWDKAYKSAMEYTHRWEYHSKIIKIFVNHQEIDNVEMELWKLPQYVKEKTKDEALASVHALKFLLSHISKLEKINLQNIF
ncbi:DUF4363 family protein [Clostridium swellfunianum]|uniref:DUF4363 family protein n=1 Tax=Clostridium swellfunianum TaxID=1367462 RepID=UPI00203030DF|nr:DUF4363 family protein [Clostridium swellfunianum]MCM0646833.1 DUF4363 family protein [Clostridium swellfunianum]